MDNFERELNNAFNTGLKLLEDPDTRASIKDVEGLASFKNIVRMVLNGALTVSVTPETQQPQQPTE